MGQEYTLIHDMINEHRERMLNIKKYYPFFRLTQVQFSQYKDGKYECLDMGYITMAVLRYFIEENNFNDRDVTYSQYIEFMRGCLKRDFELVIEDGEEEKELLDYIFDKIRNEGRPFIFEYYNPYEKEKAVSRIRLIESRIVDNTVWYSITSDGIEFYLDTKEIRDESTISVQQLLLQKMIKSQNFKGGTEVIRRINNEVRKLMLRKGEVLNILGNNIYEGLQAYEDFVETGVKWFNDEQRLFSQNTELIEMALKRAEDGNLGNPEIFSETIEDIYTLETELKKATSRHAALLSACTDLQIKADEMVKRAKVNRLKNTIDFKNILGKIVEKDKPELLEKFITPLMGVKIDKTFDLTKIDDLLTYRYEKEEEAEKIQDSNEEEIRFIDEEEDERIENNYVLIMAALLHLIKTREKITLREFNEYLKENFTDKIMKNGDYYSFLVHLCQKKEYDFSKINKEQDTFLEGIINRNIRGRVLNEYADLRFKIELADGNEDAIIINNIFEISNVTFIREV